MCRPICFVNLLRLCLITDYCRGPACAMTNHRVDVQPVKDSSTQGCSTLCVKYVEEKRPTIQFLSVEVTWAVIAPTVTSTGFYKQMSEGGNNFRFVKDRDIDYEKFVRRYKRFKHCYAPVIAPICDLGAHDRPTTSANSLRIPITIITGTDWAILPVHSTKFHNY